VGRKVMLLVIVLVFNSGMIACTDGVVRRPHGKKSTVGSAAPSPSHHDRVPLLTRLLRDHGVVSRQAYPRAEHFQARRRKQYKLSFDFCRYFGRRHLSLQLGVNNHSRPRAAAAYARAWSRRMRRASYIGCIDGLASRL
jgi:hypothetical protein